MKYFPMVFVLLLGLGVARDATGASLDAGPADVSALAVPQETPAAAVNPDAGTVVLTIPSDEETLEKDSRALADAVRTGSAIAICGAIITLLVSLLRSKWSGSLVQLIPARWRVTIPVFLSGCAGILANVGAGMPWAEAVLVGLFAGPTAVFAHEAVKESLLNGRRSRAGTVREVG